MSFGGGIHFVLEDSRDPAVQFAAARDLPAP